MFTCEICNKNADIHHIVHRHEGGLDIALNYIYLCEKHHRGKYGPHRNLEVDLIYKLRLQNSLEAMLQKRYYPFKDLMHILNISSNIMKRITKNMRLYKEGYKSEDIILYLLGGVHYTYEMIENARLEKLNL